MEDKTLSKRRIMTSAISMMTVADVRKALSEVRTHWGNNKHNTPINTSEKLFNGMHLSEFCYLFVMGHHTKRHLKSRQRNKK